MFVCVCVCVELCCFYVCVVCCTHIVVLLHPGGGADFVCLLFYVYAMSRGRCSSTLYPRRMRTLLVFVWFGLRESEPV